MTTKPVMLLDLDGVINALTPPIRVPGLPSFVRTIPKALLRMWGEDTWRTGSWDVGNMRFPLLWSTSVISQLTAWHAEGEVEIRWHTTWQANALEVARDLLGLPEFSVAQALEHEDFLRNEASLRAQQIREGRPGWWKYMTAERVLTVERRPLIWVDDELHKEINHLYRGKMGQMGNFLPICPTSELGLTGRQIRVINLYIAEFDEGAQP